MRNSNTRGSKAQGVSAHNNPAPSANMPANNTTDRSVSLGTSHNSQFGKSGKAHSSAVNGTLQPQRTAPPANMPGVGSPNLPAKNVGTDKVQLGTTKHAVGGVPGYLRGKK